MSRPDCSRRDFLRRTTALAAASTVAPYWFTGEDARAGEAKSKNDRPRIGAVGVGGRGGGIL
jgi:hypothetical protein